MQNSCKCKKIYVTSSPARNILLFHIYTFESNTNSRITSIFVKIIEASLFKKRGFRRLIKRYRLFSTRHDNSHRENLSRSNILRSRSLTRFQEQTFCLALAYVHAKRERERERECFIKFQWLAVEWEKKLCTVLVSSRRLLWTRHKNRGGEGEEKKRGKKKGEERKERKKDEARMPLKL